MLNSLLKLDAAILASERSTRPSLRGRLFRGVTAHFRARHGEWWAAALAVQFGSILYGAEPVFQISPNMVVMASKASEETWGLVAIALGTIHLLALTVNGTFPRFRWSPHIRALASFLAMGFWFAVAVAMFQSGVGGTGFGTYRLVFFLELANFLFACNDAGKIEARTPSDGR